MMKEKTEQLRQSFIEIDFAMYQMTQLQVLQSLREHLLRTIRHQTAQFIESKHTRIAGMQWYDTALI